MLSQELLEFISTENNILHKKYSQGYSKREEVMARTIKMTEEIGELSSEVLANFGNQRKRSNKNKHTSEHLEGEFADVLITTLLLADTMGIDTNKSLKDKITKLKLRYAEEYKTN